MRRIYSGLLTVITLAAVLFLLFVALTRGQSDEIVATGGAFILGKAVVAGGGTEKQMLSVGEHGTLGQTIAGQTSSGGVFTIYSGFWTPDDLMPTAALVSVGGRITTDAGMPVRNIIVRMSLPVGGFRQTRSSSMGYYSFDEVEAGEIYMI